MIIKGIKIAPVEEYMKVLPQVWRISDLSAAALQLQNLDYDIVYNLRRRWQKDGTIVQDVQGPTFWRFLYK